MRKPPKRSFNPGEREVVIIVFAFVALALGGFIFVVGFSSFQIRTAEAETTPTSVNLTPQDVAVTSDPGLEATVEIAPTIAPTVSQVLHTVAEGETLTGIAIQYGVDLQTILDANTLTVDSIVVPGQQLVIPLYPTADGLWHVVQAGETLTMIAAQYGLTPDDLLRVNALANPDTLFAGQRIFVPVAVDGGAPPADNATPTVSAGAEGLPPGGPQLSSWARSIHEGDIDINYPLTTEQARFTVHYQPGTYTEAHLTDVVQLINNALSVVEGRLQVTLEGTFDVYVAGTLFDAPDASLRGRSRSLDRRLFFLYDGSGTPADNLYLVTHELTHLVSWNTWGSPSSVMLSEGLATWAGQSILEQNGFLPYDQLCVGAYSVGKMESMAAIEVDFQSFLGHNQDRFNYFGAGCFIGYLVDTYSLGPMSRLYHTSDYPGLYGQSLNQLDAAWQAELERAQPTLTTNALDLVDYNEEWLNAANNVFRNYNGSLTMHEGYYALDLARVALWKGDYAQVRHWLDEVYRITGYTP